MFWYRFNKYKIFQIDEFYLYKKLFIVLKIMLIKFIIDKIFLKKML